jgi:hypothetical protein
MTIDPPTIGTRFTQTQISTVHLPIPSAESWQNGRFIPCRRSANQMNAHIHPLRP